MDPIPNIKKTYGIIVKEEAHRKLVCNTDTESEAVVFTTPKSVQCTHCFKPRHEAKNYYLLVGFLDWSLEHRHSFTRGKSRGSRGWGSRTGQQPPTQWATNEVATRSSLSGRPWAGQLDPPEAAPFSSFAVSSIDHGRGWAATTSASVLEDAEHNSAAQTAMTAEPGSRRGTAATAAGKPSTAQSLSASQPAVQPTSPHLPSAHNTAFQSALIQLALAQTPSTYPSAAHLAPAQLPVAKAPSIQLSVNPQPLTQSPVLLAQHFAAHTPNGQQLIPTSSSTIQPSSFPAQVD
ncbi:hypothetical protein M9H77_29851 [Catharanthus roseus]|uniref:Uncharacterized protein n=1 Tax=Catharanthus roseus TaxID=4058 RepID=A0ACB9ZXJ7_CATRO|nr:hypothetical protein M9H77_29851 [Catharanthus roseus]